MSANKHVVCPHCNAVNRIPADRLSQSPACGKCRKPVFTGEPIKLTAENYQKHINRSDLPVVVDYWAPWCGPCKMMAPAFAQVASQMEPEIRFAKVNTEEEQVIASNMAIRSIPTMVIFKNGREVARQSGAMRAADILNWVKRSV